MSKPRMTEKAALETACEFLRSRFEDAETLWLLDEAPTRLIKADDERYHYGRRATWQILFRMQSWRWETLPNPNYDMVFVDDLTGEAWWIEDNGKPTQTTWRSPWLKNKSLKQASTSAP